MLQDRLFCRISETHILVNNFTANLRGEVPEAAARLLLLALFFTIEDVEHAFARGTRGLQHLVQTMQSPDRLVEKSEVNGERDQFANLHVSSDHLRAAEP